MRAPVALLALVALALPAAAGPGVPWAAPVVAELGWGVFCGGEAMDRAPAPGTESGYIHVPRRTLHFHWPGERRVPAAPGLAFGVEARAAPGQPQSVEVRVFRPGAPAPEVWQSTISDLTAGLVFFRFDRPEEMVPGVWTFEAWAGRDLLYRVEFEVVPADALPGLVQACEATA